MKRLCGILLALLLLLGACSGEESKSGLPQENIPIGFSRSYYDDERNRGNLPLLMNLRMWECLHILHMENSTRILPYRILCITSLWKNNRMREHGLIVRSSFGRTIPPRIKISFFAYAPYVNEVENGYLSFQNEGTASGFPVLGYTVPIAVNNQIDFLAATPVMNQSNGNVTFKLHHTLTKVNVYIKSNDNTEGKSVTSFSITGMKSGLLTYYNPTTDSDIGWKWTYPSADEKESFTTGIISFQVPDTIMEEKETACNLLSASCRGRK